jgi:Family of unknown function (DUF5681)
MSNSKDEGGSGNGSYPDEPYKVGNKKPPLHTRFPKGKSGNPGGRPKASSKDLANFGDLLMKELYKTVPASLGGKTVNKMQGEIMVMQMMKAAINGKMSDRRLLLQFIEAHEVRAAKREEARLKKQADSYQEIDWDEAREQLYQKLAKAAADIAQPPAPDK